MLTKNGLKMIRNLYVLKCQYSDFLVIYYQDTNVKKRKIYIKKKSLHTKLMGIVVIMKINPPPRI